MIDHMSLSVKDYEKSKKFFSEALKPIGYSVLMDYGVAVGLGSDNKPDFWLTQNDNTQKSHIAFLAKNRSQVDEFHKAALEAGGTDNGAPGLRPNYHPNYYGAFIIDFDGNNIEVVCHSPE